MPSPSTTVARPPFLRYRILDQGGNEIIRDLIHMHESKWNIIGYQPGMTGESMVGEFEIPLPSPQDSRWDAYWATQYYLLQEGYRVEGYLDVISGNPKVSGIITGFDKKYNSAKIIGKDSTHWSLGQKTLKAEFSVPGQSHLIDAISRWTIPVYDTPASDPSGLNVYFQYASRGWSYVGTPEEGVTYYQTGTSVTSDGCITNTSGSKDKNNFVVEAFFKLTAANYIASPPAGLTMLGEAAVVASLSGGPANFDAKLIVGSATIMQDNSHTPNRTIVVGRIEQGNGTNGFNLLAQSPGAVFTLADNVNTNGIGTGGQIWRAQVQLQGKFNTSNNNLVCRLFINGIDCGISANVPITNTVQPIYPGLRYYNLGAVPAGNQVVHAYQINVRERVPAYTQGNPFVITDLPGTNSSPGKTDNLSLLNLLAASTSQEWRKDPKPASTNTPFPDTMNFGAAPIGTDYSDGRVIFEEGVNLAPDSGYKINDMSLATSLQAASSASTDQGGSLDWHNYAQVAKYGFFAKTGTNGSAQDFLGARRMAAAEVLLRAFPGAAKTLQVYRTPDNAERWRELDYVLWRSKRFGVGSQKVRILGYKIDETLNYYEAMCDQMPLGATNMRIRELSALTEFVATSGAGLAGSNSGLIQDTVAGSVDADTVYLGVQNLAGAGSVSWTPHVAYGKSGVATIRLSARFGGATSVSLTVSGTNITSSVGGPWTNGLLFVDITPYWTNGTAIQLTSTGGTAKFEGSLHVYGLDRFL